MDKRTAQDVLKSPHNDLIQLALSYVNLTEKERTALNYRYQRRNTQEHTAELMQSSTNSIQNWEKSALDKCCTVWSGIGWINRTL